MRPPLMRTVRVRPSGLGRVIPREALPPQPRSMHVVNHDCRATIRRIVEIKLVVMVAIDGVEVRLVMLGARALVVLEHAAVARP